MAHTVIRFRLRLTAERYLAFYQGAARSVSVVADDGRHILFPAGKIQRYLTETGIEGHFEMEVTEENKFVAIRRLEERS
jgi:hypothetical protein